MSAFAVPRAGAAEPPFPLALARTLAGAGIEYVLLRDPLHDPGGGDVDVAVSPASLRACDQLLRTRRLGRLVQRLWYDVPRSHYYVLATPGGFRAVDVACDPAGVGRYGETVRYALAHAQVRPDATVAAPGAELAYLAAKRARKGLGPDGRWELAGVYRRDPVGSTRALADLFGAAGTALAEALARGGQLDEPLDDIRRALGRRRRAPHVVARRAAWTLLRACVRAVAPTGLAVAVAGPDGVGKSELVAALDAARVAPFRRTVRAPHGGGVLPPPARLLGRSPLRGAGPHARPPSGAAVSLLRLAYLALDRMLGAAAVYPARVRSSLVLVERPWADVEVDPRRYRLALPAALLAAAGRLARRPDLTLVLDAPVPVVLARKVELAGAEVERQRVAWLAVARREPHRVAVLDARAPSADVLAAAVAAIADRLADRLPDLGDADLALRCVGGPRPGRDVWRAVAARRRVRWILPRSARDPVAAGLYRPARSRHAVGVRIAARLPARVPADPRRGLGPALAARLLLPEIELAASVTTDGTRGARAVLAVRSGGRTVAYAKVAEDPAPLDHEARVLGTLARCSLDAIATPAVLDLFSWHGYRVLVTERLRAPGRTDRDLGPAEVRALAELARCEPLRRLLGVRGRHVPGHGDFAPWNCARLGDGRVALWDWEDARPSLPLEDLYHWRVRRALLFRRGSVEQLARTGRTPDRCVRDLCSSLGLTVSAAPEALEAVLDRERACAS